MKQRYTVVDVLSIEKELNPETTSLSRSELYALGEKQERLIEEFGKCYQSGFLYGMGKYPSESQLLNHVVNAYPKCDMINYESDRIALFFGALIIRSFIYENQMQYKMFYGYDPEYYATSKAEADLMNKIVFFWESEED